MAIQFRDNIREIGMDAANIGFIEVARARVASKELIHEYSDGPSIESGENDRRSIYSR